MDAAADEFAMFNSVNITDVGNTTNISVANGGVTHTPPPGEDVEAI